MSVNCSTLSSSCHFFCHLLESGLARINWIRANDKICVEQLICCQKCRANACRAIAIRAVHPHSELTHGYFKSFTNSAILDFTSSNFFFFAFPTFLFLRNKKIRLLQFPSRAIIFLSRCIR